MIKSNNKSQWMLVTILSCGLLMTSCLDEQLDNPSTTETEQTSAKDPGKWWIDENNMDKSVKPGDNFFMYCNGSWWKNTTIPQGNNYVNQFTNVKPTFQERVLSLDYSTFQTFMDHLKWADDGSEAAIAGQRLYDDVLAQSGLNEATTPEDVLRAFGKMSAMGVCPGARLEPIFIDGKVCLYAKYHLEEEMVEDIYDQDQTTPDQPSLLQMMQDDPSLQSHLVPLVGRSGTRAVPDDCLPLRYIVEGMGFDPKDVYLLDDYYKRKTAYNENTYYSVKRDKRDFNSSFSLTLPIEKLKQNVLHYHGVDYGFISQKTRAAYDEQYMKENGFSPSETSKVAMKALALEMSINYAFYLRAKIVADQMVPKGLKEEYQKYCEELRAVFAQRIKANEWMSEGSKKNALEKLEAMVFNVGYPDKWIEEGLPDFSKSKSLIEDIYSFRKARIDLLKAIVGKSRQEAAFTVILMEKNAPLSKENAEYFRYYNAVAIFPYYLLPPRYDPAQSLAINYAYLYVIGHEMTHGFDNEGSQYDKNGDYREGGIWASAADKAEFDRRAGLLVDWFSTLDLLPDEMPGVKANGKETITENIADLGGAEIAWQAYLNRLQNDGYTGEELKLMKQRFFLAYANEWCAKYGQKYVERYALGKDAVPDPHSMDKERVNGVVSNMDGWYDAFDIKEGALYRKPADRIRIW